MNINTPFFLKAKKVLKYVLTAFVVLYFLMLARGSYLWYQENKTEEQVAKIHSTKLTMDDVMGKYLPQDPGVEAGKTIAGIDANNNGIRDDVELAIFKQYPNSAKTRAVLLQYALALQMEVIQPFENEGNATAVIQEESRGHRCIADTLVPGNPDAEMYRARADVEKINTFVGFVESLQLNTEERVALRKKFYEKLRGLSPLEMEGCDVDLSKILN